MSGNGPPASDERNRASFAALVLLLRELAQGLLDDGRPAEARGLIDSVEALKVKTSGNLNSEEARFLDEVLYGLHLAVVKAPAKPPGEPKEPVAGAPEAKKTKPKPAGDAPEAKGTKTKPAGAAPEAKGTKPKAAGDAPEAKGTKTKPAGHAPEANRTGKS